VKGFVVQTPCRHFFGANVFCLTVEDDSYGYAEIFPYLIAGTEPAVQKKRLKSFKNGNEKK